MATRGGYGLGRLLHLIDWKAMADSGKRFVGLSDFTAFNLALLAKTGAVSYTGATAVADFGGKRVDDLTEALFGEIMRGELEILSFETQDADPVDCRGILWGGNLAMVASLLGTPYMPKVRGGILFLEERGRASLPRRAHADPAVASRHPGQAEGHRAGPLQRLQAGAA